MQLKNNKTGVDLSLRVGNNEVATYQKDGRFYVEGKEGSEYSIHLKNNNGFRAKVVVSVDGVSVISGQPVGDNPKEVGYILGAFESQNIKGYRINDNEVAAFKFVKAEAGYAQAEKKMGGTSGVIGVRVYQEKEKTIPVPTEIHHYWHNHYNYPRYRYWDYDYPWELISPCRPVYPTPIYCRSSVTNLGGSSSLNATYGASVTANNSNTMTFGASAPVMAEASVASLNFTASAAAQINETEPESLNPFSAASTFGSKIESTTHTIEFEVGRCLGTIELFYAFREGLQKLGVDLTKTPKISFPSAFGHNYAKPPSGWKG